MYVWLPFLTVKPLILTLFPMSTLLLTPLLLCLKVIPMHYHFRISITLLTDHLFKYMIMLCFIYVIYNMYRNMLQHQNRLTWILKAVDRFVASAQKTVWSSRWCTVCWIIPEEQTSKVKKFSIHININILKLCILNNEAAYVFLVAFLEEGFFWIFVLGENLILLESKK